MYLLSKICESGLFFYGFCGDEAELRQKRKAWFRGRLVPGECPQSYLSGCYWLNFLGAPYVEMLGAERLARVPARETRWADGGVLYRLYELPTNWQANEALVLEAQSALGEDLFIDPQNADKRTRAPRLDVHELIALTTS